MKRYYTWKESLHDESFYSDEDRANDEMGITYLASEVDAERAKDREEIEDLKDILGDIIKKDKEMGEYIMKARHLLYPKALEGE